VFGELREQLLDPVTGPQSPFDLSKVAPKLDDLADAISKVYVDTEFGEQVDPPPLKWSDLRYVFDIKEDCNGKEAIQA
jgi:hypothetical protein